MTTATRTDASLLAELADKIRAATATLEAMRDRVRRELDRGAYLDTSINGDLMFAEGVHFFYRDLGIAEDGTMRRHDGEEDVDLVKDARRKRARVSERLVRRKEEPYPGLAGMRQHYQREGAKRFLEETAFLGEKTN